MMPALKSTLRFLALGACTDVATAFGTLRKGSDDEVPVFAETPEVDVPDCPCHTDWFCNITTAFSLAESRNYYTQDVMTQSVNYCWNKCFKDPSYLVASEWTPDADGKCTACDRVEETPGGRELGDWGCKCTTTASNFEQCNKPNVDGDSKVDIWYNEICNPNFKPGASGKGSVFSVYVPDKNFQEILGADAVPTDSAGDIPIKFNPFQLYEKTRTLTSSPFSTSLCRERASAQTGGYPDASTACAGVLAAGAQDVGDAAGCAAADRNNCGLSYYYGESWVYYCQPGEYDYATFGAFCSTKTSPDACGSLSEPKYTTLNPWGKWNYCQWKNGKCKVGWGLVTKPDVPASLPCTGAAKEPPQAYQMAPSTCKAMLYQLG